MAIELGYNIFGDVLKDTIVFNTTWLINILATLFTLLAITRDTNKWKELALPVMIGWHIAGLAPSILMYIGASIIFVIDKLSLQTIGTLLSVFKKAPEKAALTTVTTGKGITKAIKIPGKIGTSIKESREKRQKEYEKRLDAIIKQAKGK